MRKKLNLEELSLELPKIESKETRFLLGGSDYDDTKDLWWTDHVSGGGNNSGGPNGSADDDDDIVIGDGYQDEHDEGEDQNQDNGLNGQDQDVDLDEQDQDQGDNENGQNDNNNEEVDSNQAYEWGISDFFDHYNNGNGESVNLNDIGLRDDLRRSDVYKQVMENVKDQIKAHVLEQIELGSNYEGTFQQIWDFNNSYDFTFTEDMFAIGSASLTGNFTGDLVIASDGSWTLEGSITMQFYDSFEDPWDIINAIPGSWDPSGTPYDIVDLWSEQISITP